MQGSGVLYLASIAAAAVLGGGAAAQTPPASGPPPGGDHLVRLTNTGKGAISAVYVAPSGSTDFSDDLLGRQTASAGKTVSLKVKDPKGNCIFDVQFLMDDGANVTRKSINVCQTASYSFSR